MNKKIEKSRHSITAMIFHWGFVIIFIYGILKQVDDINQLSDISLLKSEIIFAALMMIFIAHTLYIYVKNAGNIIARGYLNVSKACSK